MKSKNHILLLLLLLLLLLCASLRLFEVFLGLIALIPLFILIRHSFLDGSFKIRLLSIAYILGSINCWIIGFLGCVYIVSNSGYEIAEYPLITMFLINLVTWGGLIGSLIAKPLKIITNSKNIIFTKLSNHLIKKAFNITLLIFFVFILSAHITGYFNIRFEIGTKIPVGSPLYILQGLSVFMPLVFFLQELAYHILFF